jgi:hypothetical protein
MAVIAAMAAFTACGLDRAITNALDPPKDSINPVAVINTPSTASVRSYINIDGSQSYGHRNGALTYAWALTEKPRCSAAGFGLSNTAPTTGSTIGATTTCIENATLSATTAGVTLYADKGGYYTVTLVVTETATVSSGGTSGGGTTSPQTTTSKLTSARINVVGSGGNHPPVAVARVATTAKDMVALSALESYDIDGQPLSYSWKIMSQVSIPDEAELRNGNSSTAYLINWLQSPYIYLMMLHVSDGVDYDEVVFQAAFN